MALDYIEVSVFLDIKPYVPVFDSRNTDKIGRLPARLTNFLKQEMMAGFMA